MMGDITDTLNTRHLFPHSISSVQFLVDTSPLSVSHIRDELGSTGEDQGKSQISRRRL